MKWIQARGSSAYYAGLVWEGAGQGEEWGIAPFSALSSLYLNGTSAVLSVGSQKWLFLHLPLPILQPLSAPATEIFGELSDLWR